MNVFVKSIIIASFFAGSLVAQAQKSAVVSGPMLGNVELRTAQVWMELKEGSDEATVTYWQKGKPKTAAKKVTQTKQDGSFLNIFKFQLPALEPATSYQYRVNVGRDPQVAGVGEFTTQDLWQYRKPAPDFSFITGSCAYFNEPKYDRPGKPYGGDSSIFEAMAKEKAAFMLWLGDNWYTREADYSSEWGLNYRASHDRSLPILQPFWKSMAHYAIWDDHDYGPNDADKSYVLKDASRKVFMNSWCNPSFGENGQGVYSKITYNDVDVFLLDDRWFRSSDFTPATINNEPNYNKKMFGEQQMEWLKNQLRFSNSNSNVHFRIIATGSQVLNPLSPWDCFRHYPAEYKEMMDFLQDEKINGVVFLTGDRHHSEINKVERKGTYPLFDITSSALTSGAAGISKEEKDSPARVLTLLDKQNYTRVSFSGEGADRKMLVEFLGLKGEKLDEWSVLLKDISNKK